MTTRTPGSKANARNAPDLDGPKDEEGKARSRAGNALKHGMARRTGQPVLPEPAGPGRLVLGRGKRTSGSARSPRPTPSGASSSSRLAPEVACRSAIAAACLETATRERSCARRKGRPAPSPTGRGAGVTWRPRRRARPSLFQGAGALGEAAVAAATAGPVVAAWLLGEGEGLNRACGGPAALRGGRSGWRTEPCSGARRPWSCRAADGRRAGRAGRTLATGRRAGRGAVGAGRGGDVRGTSRPEAGERASWGSARRETREQARLRVPGSASYPAVRGRALAQVRRSVGAAWAPAGATRRTAPRDTAGNNRGAGGPTSGPIQAPAPSTQPAAPGQPRYIFGELERVTPAREEIVPGHAAG